MLHMLCVHVHQFLILVKREKWEKDTQGQDKTINEHTVETITIYSINSKKNVSVMVICALFLALLIKYRLSVLDYKEQIN